MNSSEENLNKMFDAPAAIQLGTVESFCLSHQV